MSMNGLIVTRTTRSPSSRRSLRRRPGRAADARVSSVGMPRSQFSQMLRHRSPICGCDSEDCSDNRPSSDSRTASPQFARQFGVGDAVGDEPELLFEVVVADQRHQRSPLPDVVADHVPHRAAVRVRTRQRGQVAPGDHVVGLRAQPLQHAGVGEPIERIDEAGAPRAELRLNGHPADERRVHREHDDVADLAVVDPQCSRHDERGEDLMLRQPLQCSRFHTAQVAAAMVAMSGQRQPVVLQVHLDAVAVLRQQVEQRVVGSDTNTVAVDQDSRDRPSGELGEQLGQLRMQGRFTTAEHQHVDAAVLPRESLIHVGEHVTDRDDVVQIRRRVGETRRAAQVARLGDVFEQDAGVLGLHFRQPALVGRRDRVEIARHVRDVRLRRSRPLLQIGKDLRVFVVEGAHQPVGRAASFQPHALVAHGEPSAQTCDVAERTVGPLVMAVGAECVDVAVNSVAPKAHPGHHSPLVDRRIDTCAEPDRADRRERPSDHQPETQSFHPWSAQCQQRGAAAEREQRKPHRSCRESPLRKTKYRQPASEQAVPQRNSPQSMRTRRRQRGPRSARSNSPSGGGWPVGVGTVVGIRAVGRPARLAGGGASSCECFLSSVRGGCRSSRAGSRTSSARPRGRARAAETIAAESNPATPCRWPGRTPRRTGTPHSSRYR